MYLNESSLSDTVTNQSISQAGNNSLKTAGQYLAKYGGRAAGIVGRGVLGAVASPVAGAVGAVGLARAFGPHVQEANREAQRKQNSQIAHARAVHRNKK